MKRDKEIYIKAQEAKLAERLGFGIDTRDCHYVIGPNGKIYDGELLGRAIIGDIRICVYGNPENKKVASALDSVVRSGVVAIRSDRMYNCPVNVKSDDLKIRERYSSLRIPDCDVKEDPREERTLSGDRARRYVDEVVRRGLRDIRMRRAA